MSLHVIHVGTVPMGLAHVVDVRTSFCGCANEFLLFFEHIDLPRIPTRFGGRGQPSAMGVHH